MMSLIDALNDSNDSFFSRIQTEILKLLLNFFFEIRDFVSNFVSDFSDFLNIVFVEESLIEILMQMVDSYETLALSMILEALALFLSTYDGNFLAVNSVGLSWLILRADNVDFREDISAKQRSIGRR